MPRITYITDVKPGEPDILKAHLQSTLVIKTLDSATEIFSQVAPESGWTHAILSNIQPQNLFYGADAYLDGCWIGSTEV
ncbi:hypothetical protein C1N60_23320 (plasmid) [Pantoea sp. SGAir0184]